jgi:hypothetical protein
MDRIAYRGGYKYQLCEDYSVDVGICPEKPVNNHFLQLSCEGLLTIREGYAWDGASGPARDTKGIMRGSLVHDALYQLMREGYLDHEVFREVADRLLQKIFIEDSKQSQWFWRMISKPRAWWVYKGVRWFADPFADPAHKRPVLYAP